MLTSLDKLKICPTFHNYRFTATSGAAQALPSLSDSTTAALQDSADGADDDDDDMDDLAELMEDRSFTDLGVERTPHCDLTRPLTMWRQCSGRIWRRYGRPAGL